MTVFSIVDDPMSSSKMILVLITILVLTFLTFYFACVSYSQDTKICDLQRENKRLRDCERGGASDEI
jgi:hypothetical protein